MKDTKVEAGRGRLDDWRRVGNMLSNTEGSSHYIQDIQSIELIESNGDLQPFALSSIIKYATRYKKTKNSKDLIKIIDYAKILLGYVEIARVKEEEVEDDLVSDR